MRKSDLAGNLPRTFISFGCSETKANMQERSKTGEGQQLVISPPSTSSGTVRIPETDTSPVNTMTVLHSARPGTNNIETISQSMEMVPQKVVNPEGSAGCSGGNVNVYCEDQLRSLSEGEIQTFAEMSAQSISKILQSPIVSDGVVDESIRVDVVGDLEERGKAYLSSPAVKSASGVGNLVDSS